MAHRELGRFNQGLSSFLFSGFFQGELPGLVTNFQANDSFAIRNAQNHCQGFPELSPGLGNGKFCAARWNESLHRWWSTRQVSRPAYEQRARVLRAPVTTRPRFLFPGAAPGTRMSLRWIPATKPEGWSKYFLHCAATETIRSREFAEPIAAERRSSPSPPFRIPRHSAAHPRSGTHGPDSCSESTATGAAKPRRLPHTPDQKNLVHRSVRRLPNSPCAPPAPIAKQKFSLKTVARTFPSGSHAEGLPWLHPEQECLPALCREFQCAAHEMEKQCVRQERTPREGAKRRISSAWWFGRGREGGSIRFLFALWHSGGVRTHLSTIGSLMNSLLEELELTPEWLQGSIIPAKNSFG
jgi:hypothetical protein